MPAPLTSPRAARQRCRFASTENSIAAERKTAGRRKAGGLRGFISAATSAFIDDK